MKRCSICKEFKDHIEFAKDRASKDGLQSTCRKCDTVRHRNYMYKRLYGISREYYESLYSIQDGKCAICGKHRNILSVDHDHKSGRVRGSLCGGCNTLLARIENNPQLIDQFLNYLQKYP